MVSSNDDSLQGKVALVTGAGRGIGQAIAVMLAENGVDVAITDIDSSGSAQNQYGTTEIGGMAAAQQTAKKLESFGVRAFAIEADSGNKADVTRALERVEATLGRLDILVCNAGVVQQAPVEELAEEAWDNTFRINTKGVFLANQAAIPIMRRSGGGCIVNMASIAAKNGYPVLAHYCASKFAVVGFTNSLAKELARDGIRVNAICPGMLRTRMWEMLAQELKEPGESEEDAWQRFIDLRIPMGRPQQPSDVAELVIYLAKAKNVTGQAINVDGGCELH